MSLRTALAGVLCLVTGLIAWIMLRGQGSREDPVGIVTTHQAPESPSEVATPLRIEDVLPGSDSARDSLGAQRIIEIVDPMGAPIREATVFLCPRIERTSRSSDRQSLGVSGTDGRVVVPDSVLAASPDSHLAARAHGYLPAARPVAEIGPEGTTLVLAVEKRQGFRCTDIHGNPVPGIGILLSRLDIPSTFCRDGVDMDEEPGLDPVHALHARESDAEGLVEFGELMPGRYAFQVASGYYENVDDGQFAIVVPGPTVEVRLTTLVYAVVQVTGDHLYSWSITWDGPGWRSPSTFLRSLDGLLRRLRARYPGCLVYAGGCTSPSIPRSSIKADLLLARTGKMRVEVPLAPAFEDPEPFVVRVPPDLSGRDSVATVNFEFMDSAGRPIQCSDFFVHKDRLEFRIEVPVTAAEPSRLPIGRWSIVTHSDFLKNRFQPQFFEVSQAKETVVIQLGAELVPVRVAARGYRGEPPGRALIQVSQHGKHNSWGTSNLDSLTLWLQPGETEWYFGAMGYKPIRRSEPVLAMPDGEPQMIEFDLELSDSR